MSKRLTSVFRLDTESVQGEGSFAILRHVTMREQREIQRMVKEEISAFDLGGFLLKQNVLDWNWVDDDDEPLPNPQDDPDVIELLTDAEIEILGNALRKPESVVKN